MKKVYLVIISILLVHFSDAQQMTHYSFFTYNYMQYNPAVVGTAPCLDLKFGLRRQWKGFQGSPTTAFANVHGKIGQESKFKFTGIGAMMESDDAGPFSYTTVNLAIARHLKLANKYFLSAGLSVGFAQYGIDYGEMTLEDQVNETAITGGVNDFVFPTVGAGLWLYRSDRFYGLSVRNLNNPKIEGPADTQLRRHWTIANGYAIRVSEELAFKPAFLINYVGKSKASIDAQFLLDYKDMVSVGLAGRSGHGFSALLKLSVVKYVTIAYAYDITMNKIRYDGASTHEIIMGIRACTKANPLHVPCAAYD
jgi:type IX secretion system PorP/SprF family membrane protein